MKYSALYCVFTIPNRSVVLAVLGHSIYLSLRTTTVGISIDDVERIIMAGCSDYLRIGFPTVWARSNIATAWRRYEFNTTRLHALARDTLQSLLWDDFILS